MNKTVKFFTALFLLTTFYLFIGCNGGAVDVAKHNSDEGGFFSVFGKNTALNQLSADGLLKLEVPAGAIDKDVKLVLITQSKEVAEANLSEFLAAMAINFSPISNFYAIEAKDAKDNTVTLLSKFASFEIDFVKEEKKDNPLYLAVKNNGQWSLIAVSENPEASGSSGAYCAGSKIYLNSHHLYESLFAVVPVQNGESSVEDVISNLDIPTSLKIVSSQTALLGFIETSSDGKIKEDLAISLVIQKNNAYVPIQSNLSLTIVQKKNSSISIVSQNQTPNIPLTFSKNLEGVYVASRVINSEVAQEFINANIATYTLSLALKDRDLSDFDSGIYFTLHYKSTEGLEFSSQALHVEFRKAAPEPKIYAELYSPSETELTSLTTDPQFVISFNQGMQAASKEAVKLLNESDNQVPLNATWSKENRLLTLSPLSTLGYGKKYRLVIDKDLAVSESGLKIEDFVPVYLKTMDTGLATVEILEPIATSDLDVMNCFVRLEFSEKIDWTEFTQDKITVKYFDGLD